jgi:L-threonylcarbamoyladenylate synthase
VQRIQKIKQRSVHKGLILLASRVEQLHPYIDSSVIQQLHQCTQVPSVKPVTWLVKAGKRCPQWLVAGSESVAVRLSGLPHIDLLCSTLQAPLVSTSANISGRRTVRNSFLAHRYFEYSVDFIIEGFHTALQQASEIRELQTGKIIRP